MNVKEKLMKLLAGSGFIADMDTYAEIAEALLAYRKNNQSPASA